MNPTGMEEILRAYKAGKLSEAEVLDQIKSAGLQQLEFAQLDHHRELRQGFPEVVYCEGKTPEQIVEIARRLYTRHGRLLATRANSPVYDRLRAVFPELLYRETARCIHSPLPSPVPGSEGRIAILTAGTSDIPVAEEAALTCEMFGFPPERILDVGVAGLHRLNHHWEKIKAANILIVIAGMEGALASVVGGLVDKPVIAVPTSVGYGTALGGLTALFSMLNSCSSNVVVVNIDNGFGAGFTAAVTLKQFLKE